MTAKKGHWPAGKRRNQALPDRQIDGLMRRLEKILARKEISQAQLARDVRVDPRTIGRWLDRIDNPSAESLVRLQAWIDGQSLVGRQL